jgi:hypothetical protein
VWGGEVDDWIQVINTAKKHWEKRRLKKDLIPSGRPVRVCGCAGELQQAEEFRRGFGTGVSGEFRDQTK